MGLDDRGRPLLEGNLSAAKLAGLVPFTDPFALLQMIFTGHWLLPEAWLGAGIVVALYAVAGGRAFCAWVCPLNLITDAAAWARERLGMRDLLHLPSTMRYGCSC